MKSGTIKFLLLMLKLNYTTTMPLALNQSILRTILAFRNTIKGGSITLQTVHFWSSKKISPSEKTNLFSLGWYSTVVAIALPNPRTHPAALGSKHDFFRFMTLLS